MKTKIVEHIALDVWHTLQNARCELLSLKRDADGPKTLLNLSVVTEEVEKALRLVALLTKEDFNDTKDD
jgi:hypothetical protein